jgi:hypothetical protein
MYSLNDFRVWNGVTVINNELFATQCIYILQLVFCDVSYELCYSRSVKRSNGDQTIICIENDQPSYVQKIVFCETEFATHIVVASIM